MLAMVRFVLTTFGATSLTDVSANCTELLGKLGTATHECHRVPANSCTVSIETDTFRHHLDVLFDQTSTRAMLARLGTFHARFNAGRKFFVAHQNSPNLILPLGVRGSTLIDSCNGIANAVPEFEG